MHAARDAFSSSVIFSAPALSSMTTANCWSSKGFRAAGDDVPVDVGVALVGAEREKINPIGPYLLAYRLSHPVHDALQTEVLLDSEVARHLLFMLFRRD